MREIRDMVDDVRHMYAAIPGAPMDDFMVRIDPLAPGGVPKRLEAMRSDDFGGEWILDVPTARSDSRPHLAPPHAPLPPSPLTHAPIKPAGGRPRGLRAQAGVFDPSANALSRSVGVVASELTSSVSSPSRTVWHKWAKRPENGHHTISVQPDKAKSGKSAARFESTQARGIDAEGTSK